MKHTTDKATYIIDVSIFNGSHAQIIINVDNVSKTLIHHMLIPLSKMNGYSITEHVLEVIESYEQI